MRKPSKIIFGSIIIAVLILLYLLVIFINKEKSPEDSKPQVTDLNMQKIIKIELVNEDSKITLIKDGKDWQTDLGYKMELSEVAVFNILFSLSSLKAERIITENPSDLSVFGLEKPPISATMTLKNGKSKSLFVGNKTPSGERFYLKKNDSDTIYTVNSFFGNSFNLKMNDLRERILPALALKDLKYLKLKTDRTIEIVPLDSDDIILTSSPSILKFKRPFTNKLLNLYSFSKMLESLAPLFYITHFIEDRPKDLNKYGLKYPEAEIKLADKEGRSLDLLIGKKTENKDDELRYAKLRNKPEVFTTDITETAFMDLKPLDLVSKFILLININYIDSFQIKSQDFKLKAKILRENKGKDVKYKINDKIIEEDNFKKLYQRVIGLVADNENPKKRTAGAIDVRIDYVLNIPGKKYLSLVFKEYNKDFYRAVSSGISDFLISKDQVKDLVEFSKQY